MRSVRIQCVARIFWRKGLCEPSGSLLSFACHGPHITAVRTSERICVDGTPHIAQAGEPAGWYQISAMEPASASATGVKIQYGSFRQWTSCTLWKSEPTNFHERKMSTSIAQIVPTL